MAVSSQVSQEAGHEIWQLELESTQVEQELSQVSQAPVVLFKNQPYPQPLISNGV